MQLINGCKEMEYSFPQMGTQELLPTAEDFWGRLGLN